MRASLLLSSSGLALLMLAACSSSQTARAFDEEDASTATQTPEQTSTPPPSSSSGGPVGTGDGDGGYGDDGSSCKGTPPSNKCGLIDQCGCTSAQTCDVQDTSGNVGCVTAGTAAMGAPCVTTAGCAHGLTCSNGTCHAFCNNPGSACTIAKTGPCLQLQQDSKDIPNLAVCEITCDLRDANACGGVTAAGAGVCYVDDTGVTDCALGGTVAAGGACSDTALCGPALTCASVTSGGASTCHKWCKVGTTDCGGSTMCLGFGTKVMVGTTEFGVCP